MNLVDVCNYVKDCTTDFDESNYISTENMLPDKGGITEPTNIPSGAAVAYADSNVLVSNIRPYFRKIWFADCDGGCSNDTLVLWSKDTCDPDFLYGLLFDSNFFDYATATGKGTKMPQGDKSAIMRYSVPDVPIDTQVGIATTLRTLDDKIAANNKLNHNLSLSGKQTNAVFMWTFAVKAAA